MGQCYLLIFPDSKVYVGITRYTAETRFSEHVRCHKRPVVTQHIQRWGADRVTVVVLAESEDWWELCRIERSFIALFLSDLPEFGLNQTEGGSPGPLTPAARDRHAKACADHGRTAEERARRAVRRQRAHDLRRIQNGGPWYGKNAEREAMRRQSMTDEELYQEKISRLDWKCDDPPTLEEVLYRIRERALISVSDLSYLFGVKDSCVRSLLLKDRIALGPWDSRAYEDFVYPKQNRYNDRVWEYSQSFDRREAEPWIIRNYEELTRLGGCQKSRAVRGIRFCQRRKVNFRLNSVGATA